VHKVFLARSVPKMNNNNDDDKILSPAILYRTRLKKTIKISIDLPCNNNDDIMTLLYRYASITTCPVLAATCQRRTGDITAGPGVIIFYYYKYVVVINPRENDS